MHSFQSGHYSVGTPVEYYDSYMYVEKATNNKYLIVERVIKSNGSELVTQSHGTYDEEKSLLIKKKSHKTSKATGDFNRSWTVAGGERKVDGFDYMYSLKNPNLFARKY